MALLPFSDTTNRTGVIQLIEDMTGTQGSSSSSYTLATKVRDANMALMDFFMIAMQADGKFRTDDTNQSDFPCLYFDIVSGQGDYSFLNDGSAIPNQILDIHKVEVKDANGNWVTLEKYDRFQDGEKAIGQLETVSGTPTRYAKNSNALFFDSKFNYNSTDGGRIFFSRSPSYFTTSDTTKEPGVPDMFKRWVALKPSFDYCVRKSLSQKDDYRLELYGNNPNVSGGMKKAIEIYYGSRDKDDRPVLRMKRISHR